MKKSLFSLLNTCNLSESVNREENYSTELLVYLLNYSLKNATDLFRHFMEFLGEDIEESNYNDFKISTQNIFYTTTNIKAIPDITIETKDNFIFIEVKVESGLNYYLIENADESTTIINQIQKYQTIDSSKQKNIYLLTKYSYNEQINGCPDFRKKFKWFEIHKLLKDYRSKNSIENYLVTEIIQFMEDKGMTIPKVSHEIVAGMESLRNLRRQIETALEGIPYQKSFGYEWMGYYVVNSSTAWVGNYYEGHRLSFEHHHPKVIKFIEDKNLQNYELCEDKKHYCTYFDFERNRYFCLSAEEQLDLLRKWIKENYELIEENL